MECKIIAHIKTDFDTKFGVPRQAGLVPELEGSIVFEPDYRTAEALRGLEGYSHLWLIWVFSEVSFERPASDEANSSTRSWSPTVRPPRLGGNRRMGVFATRSPFRPNPIGLSCVEIAGIELNTPQGPIIRVKESCPTIRTHLMQHIVTAPIGTGDTIAASILKADKRTKAPHGSDTGGAL